MRVGRKSNAVNLNTKPISLRNCAVRVEKVKRPTASSTLSQSATSVKRNITSQYEQNVTMLGNWRTATTRLQEDKFRGPLKKRPITEMPSTAAKALLHTSAKSERFPTGAKTAKSGSAQNQQHPTIAAGRSRRAIKPNPKYTSEDLVTPRNLKNVVASSSTEKLKVGRLSSAIDNFYNRESSDDIGCDEEFDNITEKTLNDSENSDDEVKASQVARRRSETNISGTVPRRRGRPRRQLQVTVDGNTTMTEKISSAAGNVSRLTAKELNVYSSIERRKEEVSNSSIPINQKRKLSNEKDAESEYFVTRKRYLISTVGQKFKALEEEEPKILTRSTMPKQKRVNTYTSESAQNGNRASKRISAEENGDEILVNMFKNHSSMQSKKPSISKDCVKIMQKPPKTLPTVTRTRSQFVQAAKLNNSVSLSSVNKMAKEQYREVMSCEGNKNHLLDSSPADALDDYDTMPTFTIVNINDIISKKGDALISKTTTLNVQSNNTSESAASNTTEATTKIDLRKHASELDGDRRLLRNKTVPIRRRPPQTILNHNLGNSKMARQFVLPLQMNSKKQAPRILNAMVAKKTQPVKPMTANPDDSADESFTLSLDDDDYDDHSNVYDDLGDAFEPNYHDENVDAEYNSLCKYSTQSGKSLKNKISPTNSKENSLSAINLKLNNEQFLLGETPQRRLPPEKVEITRQGDKIIKKITCLENWYVILRDKQMPMPNILRNTLNMALIDLANIAARLSLPSGHWSSKVTLYELPVAMLAKTTLTTFIGSLSEHNIAEEDRTKYQPSCVMFRRAVSKLEKSRLPYDRAVIFKNNTFYTNIEGKNVRLVGAPETINNSKDVEILLQIVDTLSLQSTHIELVTSI